MITRKKIAEIMQATVAQVDAFKMRAESPAEIHYGDMMQRVATILALHFRSASFDQLIALEKTFQANDLLVYATLSSTLKSVQQGIRDIKAGEAVYRQLVNDPASYKAHKYRENEHAGPDRLVPLDAMRLALRGQVKRVENYRTNVMANIKEQEFLSARSAMLRHAEKLYDAIQREHFPPPENDG